jgi:hypothetical protein
MLVRDGGSSRCADDYAREGCELKGGDLWDRGRPDRLFERQLSRLASKERAGRPRSQSQQLNRPCILKESRDAIAHTQSLAENIGTASST